ncbi:Uncharacterised protein [uncultured Avibacterium sp.]|uniref:Uncharacterized protein n=3 Tax=Avibacterium TaxID=292486 RepID=A0A486XCA6_9PAST|nr:Uncharacterised protein [uncultured Avibacterium sp.]
MILRISTEKYIFPLMIMISLFLVYIHYSGMRTKERNIEKANHIISILKSEFGELQNKKYGNAVHSSYSLWFEDSIKNYEKKLTSLRFRKVNNIYCYDKSSIQVIGDKDDGVFFLYYVKDERCN